MYKLSLVFVSIVLVFTSCDISSNSNSQQNNESQFTNVRISYATNTSRPNEVTIDIDPNNPLNLVAGANIDYYFYSDDGGNTWNEGHLSSTYGVHGDPVITFDNYSNIYYGHLSRPAGGSLADRIVIQKSTDGGKSWNNGAGIGLTMDSEKLQDKEWIGIDFTDSPYKDNIYVSWTEFDRYASANPEDKSRIRFSRSTDLGETWSEPIVISDKEGDCLDDDNTMEGAVPAIGPNGEIFIAWAGPDGLYFDKSTDGGKTFGADQILTDVPGGWGFNVQGIYRCNGLPFTVCDISNTATNGNIYVLWADQRNGTNNTDIFLMKSTNGGSSWSEIKQVNDDNTSKHQFFPNITIDPITGYIYIVFYDRRNTVGYLTDVYIARSTDGGETFENQKVSASSFTPDQGVFFGDYIDIAAYDGMIYPCWMRMDGFSMSVWTAIVDDSEL